MLQLVLTVIIFMIIVIPIGNYLYHIASGQRTSPIRCSTGGRRDFQGVLAFIPTRA